jgi:phage antirepressor YoqD-like protein
MSTEAEKGNSLMNVTAPLTMSSREIAALLEKQHGNIKISAERLAEKGVIALQETPYIDQQNKQTYSEYLLNKRDSLILVAQNCPEFTARIIDRWQELEAKAEKPPVAALPDRRKLALMILEAEEEIAAKNQQIQEQQAVIDVAAPKAEALDLLTEKEGRFSLTVAAKSLSIPPKKFIQYLIDNKWVYRTSEKGDLTPAQDKLTRGLLEQKLVPIYSTSGGETIRHQALVTTKGIGYLATALSAFRLQA